MSLILLHYDNHFLVSHNTEIESLTRTFGSYPSITKVSIQEWLNQFESYDMELGLKILKNVIFFDKTKIYNAYASVHKLLKHILGKKLSQVYFIPFGKISDSGTHMIYLYKSANNLTNAESMKKFKGVSDIVDLLLADDLIIVYLDDFIGSGMQAIKIWKGTEGRDSAQPFEAHLPNAKKVFLAVVAAYDEGVQKIQKETNGKLEVLYGTSLSDKNKALSPNSQAFTPKEKERINYYCNLTGSLFPTGFNDMQSTVVFEHNCPNDSLSILWCDTPRWKGLFRRYN
ncbi:MAG: hypothetical protein JRN10_01060 [Nitrososphaerota archaeon]|nr:hypothetical protein [Nitrososphaerota archaeon]MDG7036798.1 hypothetical protein [Nitrososphaerota archaeon]MDG7039135.1 hypothetical protein [Nitrososphaerota archaeon]